MKIAIWCLVLLTGSAVFAAEPKTNPMHVNLFPLNYEARYERESSQQVINRNPRNIAAGLRKGPSTWILEYSRFEETTGNNALSVKREHREYTLWWKENLMNLEFMDFFASVGLGAYEEKTTSTLLGSTATDSSGSQLMGGGSVGVQSLVAKYFLASAEARVLMGRNFDPNPQGGFVLRLGLEF